MADIRPIRKDDEGELEHVVRTYLINVVQYGYVTIRYEAGRPTMVERHEQVRLTGREGRTPEPA